MIKFNSSQINKCGLVLHCSLFDDIHLVPKDPLKLNNPDILYVIFKGWLSCLRQFLATESLLKITKNAFYFT